MSITLTENQTKLKKEIAKIMFDIKSYQSELEDTQRELDRIIPYEDGLYYYNKKIKLQAKITNETEQLVRELNIFMSFFRLDLN